MAIRVVRLGAPRHPEEGVRIGTVRRPPRGVPKVEYASRDYYDAWLPELAPTSELMKLGKAAESDEGWARFASELQQRILDAAIRAPSGGNAQNWRFLLVDDQGVALDVFPDDVLVPQTRCEVGHDP